MDININFSGATYSLFSEFVSEFTILGTGTLTANYTISTSITPVAGKTFVFYYKATVDKATFNFNILGTNLTEVQLNRESTIEAVYNGTSWDLNITPNTKSTGWLATTDSALAGNDLVLMTFTVSFEAGKQGNNAIYVPFDFQLNNGAYCVTKAIAGTESGYIDILTNGVSRGITEVLASGTVNTVAQATINDNTGDFGGSWMQIVSSKATPGGEVLFSLILERI